MSIQDVGSPVSISGSSAGSPAPSNPPATPVTPQSGNNPSLPKSEADTNTSSQSPTNTAANNSIAAAPPKRKPSRRANTAERRATHNAVERQRRETLNGRFLDLAALLPNLVSVRRPSKSAIVNSSIAFIHLHRRQRLQAARELRALKLESDAIRREVNEWRDRTGLPRVEEPARSSEFLTLINEGDSDNEEGNWYSDLNEMGEEERRAYELVLGGEEDGEEPLMEEDEDFATARTNTTVQKGMGPGNTINLQHILPRNVPAQQSQSGRPAYPVRPQVVSPTAIGFDASQMPSHPGLPNGIHTMYEPNGHPHGHSHSLPVHPNFVAASTFPLGIPNGDGQMEKVANAGWNNAMFQSQNTQPQWAHQLPAGVNTQHGLFTPPGTANSAIGNDPPSPLGLANPFANSHALLSNLQQQQQQQQQHSSMMGHSGHMGHVYASPELDDASSVSSAEGNAANNMNGRRTSGGSCSPPHSATGGMPDGFGRKLSSGAGGGLSMGVGINVQHQRVGPQWGTPPAAQVGMMAMM